MDQLNIDTEIDERELLGEPLEASNTSVDQSEELDFSSPKNRIGEKLEKRPADRDIPNVRQKTVLAQSDELPDSGIVPVEKTRIAVPDISHAKNENEKSE